MMALYLARGGSYRPKASKPVVKRYRDRIPEVWFRNFSTDLKSRPKPQLTKLMGNRIRSRKNMGLAR